MHASEIASTPSTVAVSHSSRTSGGQSTSRSLPWLHPSYEIDQGKTRFEAKFRPSQKCRVHRARDAMSLEEKAGMVGARPG
jgi:hypothetical protein